MPLKHELLDDELCSFCVSLAFSEGTGICDEWRRGSSGGASHLARGGVHITNFSWLVDALGGIAPGIDPMTSLVSIPEGGFAATGVAGGGNGVGTVDGPGAADMVSAIGTVGTGAVGGAIRSGTVTVSVGVVNLTLHSTVTILHCSQ